MRKKVLSIWLSVCMVLTMLTFSVMAEEGSKPAGARGEIISFEPLAESEKSVEAGKSIENLELPEELTATVRTAVPADSGTEEEPVQDSGEFQENDALADPAVATASSAIKESGDDHDKAPAPEWEETTVDIPVTWTAEPEYTGNETGDFVFTPVIKGYAVSADLPEINVTVGAQLPMMVLRAGTSATYGDFSVSIDEDGAAPVYDNGVLSLGTAGEYTVSMADGKDSTSDRIVVTVAGVTLNLDGVEINAQDGLKGGQNGANALTVTSGTVTLSVIEDSSLTGGAGYSSTYAPTNGGSGISGNVVVTGTETLCVNGGTGGFSEVVLSNSGSGILGDVSISRAVNVIAVGGNNQNPGPGRAGNGITGHVSVSNGAILTAVGGVSQSPMYTGGNGINGNLTVTGNASANLTGGDAILSTPGMALTGTLTATDVTLKGGFTGLTDEITSKDPRLNKFHYVAVEPALVSNNSTFDFCNGTATVTVKPSSDPQWEETGYSFAGWYTAPNGQGTELIGAGDSGVTYYAKWNYNGYTVRTTALDLTGISGSKPYGSTPSGSVYTNPAEGWTWYAAETTVDGERYAANTLVLSGMTVHTTASAALTVPDETTVVLEEDSENAVISGYTSSSEDVFTYGLYGKGALHMKGSGTLNAQAGTAAYTNSNSEKEGSSYGIYSMGALNFSSCTVNAYGGRGVTTGSDNKSCGIYSDATLNISSGSITGYGGSGRVQSIGIVSQGNIEITGGTVTGIAGDAEASYGIISGFLSVDITGGTITAKNGAAANSAAIATLGDGSISKLTVGSLEKPAAIANASDGTNLIATSNGEILSKQLVMSGSDAVVVSFSTYVITANAAINGSYSVTVNGSTLAYARSGDTVAITPTAESGYDVDSISVCKTSDTNIAVTVTDGSFTMPDYAVTVSVIFKLSAPTDVQLLAAAKTAAQNKGYGNMTQAAAPDGEVIKASLKQIAETAVNNSGITVTINKVSYIPPIAGTSNISLIDKNITDAIADAKAVAAKKNVNASDITAIIHVTTGGKDPDKVIVNLPKTTQEQVIDNKIASVQLVIDHPDLTIGINLAAIAEINRQAKADVQLSAVRIDNSKLSGNAKAAIGNRPAYDFNAVNGRGESVADFGNGRVSVEIPYTLQKGEAEGNICAVYVDANDKITYLTDSSYDAKRGTVVFSTSHFSTYGIACKGDASFTDINEHWAKDDILFAVNRGILTGTSSTTFSPNASMTRERFITALGRLANADISAYKKSSFSDVKTDACYMGYIEWGVKNNILDGIGGGKFDPDGLVTREQIAVMLDRYATAMGFKLPEVHTQNTITTHKSQLPVPKFRQFCGALLS